MSLMSFNVLLVAYIVVALYCPQLARELLPRKKSAGKTAPTTPLPRIHRTSSTTPPRIHRNSSTTPPPSNLQNFIDYPSSNSQNFIDYPPRIYRTSSTTPPPPRIHRTSSTTPPRILLPYTCIMPDILFCLLLISFLATGLNLGSA